MDRFVPWVRRLGPLACLLGLAWAGPAPAGPVIHVVEKESIVLRIQPLTARVVGARQDVILEVDDTTVAEIELALEWPDPQVPSRLWLRATRLPALVGLGRFVRLESELLEADGRTTRAVREIAFEDEFASITTLFEVARVESGPLTLAVAGEVTMRTSLSARPVVGPPVQFLLEIQWVENGNSTSLETDQLQTFVGQSVSYSFRLGRPGEAESGSVRLLPVQLIGDTLRIEVEMSGTLPDGEDSIAIISRTEEWLSTSGATSSLALQTGEPPKGFRFRITPRF